MGELSVGADEIQKPQGEQAEHGDVDPSLKARTRIGELLSPSENRAQIQELFLSGGREIVKEHPHPEMQRIVQTAIGVLLWEQKASFTDSNSSLPLGLTAKLNENNRITKIAFDPKYLSKAEYDYVADKFADNGIQSQVEQLQQSERESKRADIVEAVAEYLKYSPVATLLETFKVTQRADNARNSSNLRDLTQREEEILRVQLEAEFTKKYDTDSTGMPADLHPAHRLEVTSPLNSATRIDTDDTSSHEEDTTVSRRRFREFIQERFLLQDGFNGAGLRKDQVGSVTVSRNRLILDGYEVENWYGFCDEEMNSLNDTLYSAPTEYARYAFQIVGAKLYDKKDTRDAQEIIDEGFDQAATALAEDMITRQQRFLYGSMYDSHMNNLLWLSAIEGPLYTDEDTDIESPDVHHGYMPPLARSGEIVSAYALDKAQQAKAGRIKSIDPNVLLGVPRLIRKVPRNYDLPLTPLVPAGLVPELVLEATNDSLAKGYGTGSPDRQDPTILGMDLWARDGTTCYFVLKPDPEADPYRPSDKQLSYIKRRKAADFCAEIGMGQLAQQIDAYDTLTIAQLVTLMRQNVRYAVPEQKEKHELNSPEQWKHVVDQDGILHGQSQVFAAFTQKLFLEMYPPNGKGEYHAIEVINGYTLDNKEAVNTQIHFQTQIDVPSEDVDIIVDISPNTATLKEITATVPHTPPPMEEVSRGFGSRTENVSLLAQNEFKKLLHESVGQMLTVSPEVFEQARIRLFSKVARDKTLPTLDDLPPDIRNKLALGITCTGTELADAEHDPYLGGMKLIAREGSDFFFIIDRESTDYQPVLDPIPTQIRNELTITLLNLRMPGLAEMIYTDENLTYEQVRQLVRRYSKYTVPLTDRIDSQVSTILDFQDAVDSNGMVREQCNGFEIYMRKLSDIIYGPYVASQEVGFALVNSKNISKMTHAQTRINKPGTNALIDVNPMHYDVPDLDEKPFLPGIDADTSIVFNKIGEDEIEKLIGIIGAGGSWPENLRGVLLFDDSEPQKRSSIFKRIKKAFFDSLNPQEKLTLLHRVRKALQGSPRSTQEPERVKVTVGEYVALLEQNQSEKGGIV